jgi:hypothetical protein
MDLRSKSRLVLFSKINRYAVTRRRRKGEDLLRDGTKLWPAYMLMRCV